MPPWFLRRCQPPVSTPWATRANSSRLNEKLVADQIRVERPWLVAMEAHDVDEKSVEALLGAKIQGHFWPLTW